MINPLSDSRSPRINKRYAFKGCSKWHPYANDRRISSNAPTSSAGNARSRPLNQCSRITLSASSSRHSLSRGREKGRLRIRRSAQGISSPNPSTSPLHVSLDGRAESPRDSLIDRQSESLSDEEAHQYTPRMKPMLACANESYAKDLVAQCVAMVQEIYVLPPDPALPPGVYLPGHAPPPVQIPQPLGAQTAGQAFGNQLLTPPASSVSGSPVESSDGEDSADDEPEDAETHSVHSYGGHQQPIHHHPPVTLTPAQQAATFAQNLLYFVHEVLRRSRTPCSTLEVAMCYIGAIRATVRGILGERDELQRRARALNVQPFQLDIRRVFSTPLHDARRTFLASLVLASKFQQDRAYSNKAWAKLSGLPAQEVTRCENSLGNALHWRLWVGRDIHVAATDFNPPPSIAFGVNPVSDVPGIVSSGRCLSPPTCNVSADMLEMELFQEELLAGGVHSAHGPNGVPGEADAIAACFLAAAQAEEASLCFVKHKHSLRRHATEPSIIVSEAALGRVTKSLSVGYPGGVNDNVWHLGTESLSPAPSFNEWLVDDPYGNSPAEMTVAEREKNASPYGTDSECGMSHAQSSSRASSQGDSVFSVRTTESTPVSTPTLSVCDSMYPMRDEDIPLPPAPRLIEPVLPISSVVGAFRVPRTPLPRMVIPASADAVGWFPPPHFVQKMSVHTPPTEYRLLPQVTPPAAPAKPAQAPSQASLHTVSSSPSSTTPMNSLGSQMTPGSSLHDFMSSSSYTMVVG